MAMPDKFCNLEVHWQWRLIGSTTGVIRVSSNLLFIVISPTLACIHRVGRQPIFHVPGKGKALGHEAIKVPLDCWRGRGR